MITFDLQPATDMGLPYRQRTLSLARESGLVQTGTHLLWWSFIRLYLKLVHHMRVEGLRNVPQEPPFVIVANHTSHLDTMMMASLLPWRMRDRIFPLAAADYFFPSLMMSTFATAFINALPIQRKHCCRHLVGQLRKRMLEEPCAYVVFPEGSRSSNGTLQQFKAGLGVLVAETSVPVVPCLLDGAHEAMPRGYLCPSPHKLRIRIGQPLQFDHVPNQRAGWDQIASKTRAAVQMLNPRSDRVAASRLSTDLESD